MFKENTFVIVDLVQELMYFLYKGFPNKGDMF